MNALPSKNRWWTTWGAVLAISSFVGIFFAAQMHFSSAALGHPVSWGQALYWAMGDWYEWAILSPLIFQLSRRFSFERGRWRGSLGIHVIAGVVLSVVHLVLCGLAEQLQGLAEGHKV